MATEQTSGRPAGAVADAKEKGEELVSSAQEQISTKAQELGGEAKFQIREQLEQRSTETGRARAVDREGSALERKSTP